MIRNRRDPIGSRYSLICMVTCSWINYPGRKLTSPAEHTCYTVPSANVTLEEVKGGNSVKHWAHLRLKMRRGPKADWPKPIKVKCLDGKERDKHPGWSCAIKIDKTRLNASESQEILLPFYYGRGFDSVLSTITAAMGLDIITRKGAYYECSLLTEKVQGKDEIVSIFSKDASLLAALGKLVDEVSLTKGITSEVGLQTSEEPIEEQAG